MTIQQITDRLAEEAGWVFKPPGQFNSHCGYWHGPGRQVRSSDPFPPDSIDAAVRAVGDVCDLRITRCNGEWQVTMFQVMHPMGDDVSAFGDHPAHALYFACAKARGWM